VREATRRHKKCIAGIPLLAEEGNVAQFEFIHTFSSGDSNASELV